MINRTDIYVNGQWIPSEAIDQLQVTNSSTEQVMATVPNGVAADVDKAVAAARDAFTSWSQSSVVERQQHLRSIAHEIRARVEEIATTVSAELGMPISLSRPIQAELPAITFEAFADVLDDFAFEEQIGVSRVVKEPAGVLGAITPWNYPLHQVSSKVGAALAAGCTVVLKPSEVTPLNAYLLTEAINASTLPEGVFNLVIGVGPVVGEALVGHVDVDIISFTGSTGAGKRIAANAAQNLTQVSLELGGKSANIILDDTDLDAVLPGSLNDFWLNSGQTCTAQSRMLVARSRYDEAVDKIADLASQAIVDDPTEEGIHMGPLVSQAQWDRVQDYIRLGIDEGARLIAGGLGKPDGKEVGFYTKPTVFADVDNSMRIAQEEIFGPVLVVIPFDDDNDAIRIANDSEYGLSGAVWSGDDERAEAVARQMDTGQIMVNGGRYNLVAPFGGYKNSGYGRENGVYGIEEFLNIKSMQFRKD